jgi:dienelactone hydrolase
MKYLSLLPLLIFLGCASSGDNIKGIEVDYTANGVVLKGYLAYDESLEGQRPGVLVVHEWWGHNEYARERARMLAELGYTALAVDMYGEGKQAEHPEDAGKFASEVMQNMEVGQARFMAALELLKQHETTDPERIAAIGYCFGGAVVLNMARLGVDLDGVVSFHGSLATQHPAEPGKVKAKILVCHGAEDQFVTQEQIDQFKEEMKNANVDLQFISYEGAKHSFTNPEADTYGEKFNLPLAYNEEADKKSWADMQKFFDSIFEE